MIAKRSVVSFTCLMVFSGLLLSSAHAWDSRLLGMDNPTLSQSMGAQYSNVDIYFPTESLDFMMGNSLGLSAVADDSDIWKLPARLADLNLYPNSQLILDYENPLLGTAGIVVASQDMPLVFGLFGLRQVDNSWVTGGMRDEFIGQDFFTSGSAGTTAPLVEPSSPENIIDLMTALRLGSLNLGLGVGFAYDLDDSDSGEVVGTPDSDFTSQASSSVITIRAGAGLDLSPAPVQLDFGLLLPISSYSTTYKSGINAGNENDSITAGNMALNLCGRAFIELSQALDWVVLADYVSVPQDFKAMDDGVDLSNTVIRKDPTTVGSLGIGTGLNWQQNQNLVNLLLTAVFGGVSYVLEAPAAANRPDDSSSWNSLRLVLGGEFPLSQFFVLRGGLSGAMSWETDKVASATGGTDSETTSFYLNSSASAGLGVKVIKNVNLDFVLSLYNFSLLTSMTSPAWRTTMQVQIAELPL